MVRAWEHGSNHHGRLSPHPRLVRHQEEDQLGPVWHHCLQGLHQSMQQKTRCSRLKPISKFTVVVAPEIIQRLFAVLRASPFQELAVLILGVEHMSTKCRTQLASSFGGKNKNKTGKKNRGNKEEEQNKKKKRRRRKKKKTKRTRKKKKKEKKGKKENGPRWASAPCRAAPWCPGQSAWAARW